MPSSKLRLKTTVKLVQKFNQEWILLTVYMSGDQWRANTDDTQIVHEN